MKIQKIYFLVDKSGLERRRTQISTSGSAVVLAWLIILLSYLIATFRAQAINYSPTGGLQQHTTNITTRPHHTTPHTTHSTPLSTQLQSHKHFAFALAAGGTSDLDSAHPTLHYCSPPPHFGWPYMMMPANLPELDVIAELTWIIDCLGTYVLGYFLHVASAAKQ